MTKRRKLGLVIGVPSVLALGLIAWGGYWASLRIREGNAARAALSAFIAKLGEGRIDDAYRSAAPELRCRLPLAQFRGLVNYYAKLQPATHADVSLRHGWPYVHAADIELSTHYDQDIPHHAAMVKLDDGWRVAWIDRKPAAEVQALDRKCGERSMHIAMIRQPLRDLLEGFERNDYGALAGRFHRSRNQTAAGIEKSYARLKASAAALKEALGAEPAFDADPARNDGGWSLAASLRAHAVRFSVRAELILDNDWKLMRLDVETAAAPD